MANKQIKSRILLPVGTEQELNSRYERTELSAGELLIVKTANDQFHLSAGVANRTAAKLKVKAEDVMLNDVSSASDEFYSIESDISDMSSWLGRNFSDFSDDTGTNELKVKKQFGLRANAITVGSRSAAIPLVGNGSLVNGDNCIAVSAYSHAEGSNTFSTGTASHAEGGGTAASNLVAHSEGAYTSASGIAAHSEGLGLLSSDDVNNLISQLEIAQPQTAAYLRALIAEGLGVAKAPVSHTEGYMTAASGMGSHVDGVNASDGGHAHTFVWQGYDGRTLTSADVKVLTDGLEGEQHNPQFPTVAMKALQILGDTQRYTSNGPGTFNINPAGGVNGFFIGIQSLSAIISSAIQPLQDQINTLNARLNNI